jgi:hypothetical protein
MPECAGHAGLPREKQKEECLREKGEGGAGTGRLPLAVCHNGFETREVQIRGSFDRDQAVFHPVLPHSSENRATNPGLNLASG